MASFSSPAVALLPPSSSSPASTPPLSSALAVAPPPSDFSRPALSSVWPGLAALVGSTLAPAVSAVPVSLSAPLPSSSYAPLLFRPFSADPRPSAPVPSVSFAPSLSATPVAPVLAPPSALSAPDSLSFGVPASSSPFLAPDELLLGAAPDALPSDIDPAFPAVALESVCSEFRRMLSFLVDLFPRAAGSQSAPPPPWALFEDFFGSAAPHCPPIFLSWFE